MRWVFRNFFSAQLYSHSRRVYAIFLVNSMYARTALSGAHVTPRKSDRCSFTTFLYILYNAAGNLENYAILLPNRNVTIVARYLLWCRRCIVSAFFPVCHIYSYYFPRNKTIRVLWEKENFLGKNFILCYKYTHAHFINHIVVLRWTILFCVQ